MIAPILIALSVAGAPVPQDKANHAEFGQETSIPFAANGGLRNWQAGDERNILYVQDRRLKWYRVTLSGPCVDRFSGFAIGYTTSVTGSFDNFSEVYSSRYPDAVCSVVRIVTSPPPEGQPGARKKHADTD